MADERAPDKAITRQMELFCQEYLVDLNATRAAERAGYSVRSAHQLGHKLRKDPRVLARINELMREREESTRIKGYLVLEELATVVKSSRDHYTTDDDGNVVPKPEAPPGAMGAVQRIKIKRRVLETTTQYDGDTATTTQLVEVETDFALYDKNPAIANAMKHLGLLKDVVEHRDLTLEDILREAAGKPAGGTVDAGDRETK